MTLASESPARCKDDLGGQEKGKAVGGHVHEGMTLASRCKDDLIEKCEGGEETGGGGGEGMGHTSRTLSVLHT